MIFLFESNHSVTRVTVKYYNFSALSVAILHKALCKYLSYVLSKKWYSIEIQQIKYHTIFHIFMEMVKYSLLDSNKWSHFVGKVWIAHG